MMDTLLNFFHVLDLYPKGVLLSCIAVFNIFWVFYIVFWRGNFKKILYKTYFFYSLFILLNVLANAYFQLPTLIFFQEKGAHIMALFANVVSLFAMISFFYISLYLRYEGKKIPIVWIVFMWFVGGMTLLFNCIPYFFPISGVNIISPYEFELILTSWNDYFFIFPLLTIFLGFFHFIVAIWNKRASIENIRFFYIFFGMSLMYGSELICSVMLPVVFQNFSWVWIPPFLSIADVLIFGYAIEIRDKETLLVQRFSDVKFIFVQVLKSFIAFIVSLIFSLFFYHALNFFFQEIEKLNFYIATGFFLYIFHKIFSFFHSPWIYKIIGETNVELLRDHLLLLQKKNILYKDVESLQKDVFSVFQKFLPIQGTQCILPTEFSLKYPCLSMHFKAHRHLLMLQEIKLLEHEYEKPFLFTQELESLGEICLPLYQPSGVSVAYFVFGKKKNNKIYSKEEIEAIEGLTTFLSLHFTSLSYNTQLQQEVLEKTKELREKNESMAELLQQQSDFISLTSHELRTPITVAKASLEILELESSLSEIFKKRLHSAYRAIVNMQKLVERIFEVQSFDMNAIQLQKTSMNLFQFFEEIEKEFLPFFTEKQIQFSLQFLLPKTIVLLFDPVRVKQVVTNILSNAKMYTPEGGKIEIEITENEQEYCFRFSDSGIGVPESMREIIFYRFRSNHVMESPGLGLGLYVCKKIVQLHQGKIFVKTSKFGGACFVIQLPKPNSTF